MKISLRWLFDHIAAQVDLVDVEGLVAVFNKKIAEMEHWYAQELPLDLWFAGQVTAVQGQNVCLDCPELSTQITLPARTDAAVGAWYLICKQDEGYRFVALADFGSSKEGLLTAVDIDKQSALGGWKEWVEKKDYILDVNNTSITHRPDLWGHYGLAREIAACMGYELKPLELVQLQVTQGQKTAQTGTVHVTIDDQASCARLSVLAGISVVQKPSHPGVAVRLARVDSRPINAVVDFTNYVMFETSQPMHVFDAAGFSDAMTVRKAGAGEQLELLDDRAITLCDADIVITDGIKPVSLAGVMGGKQASFSHTTSSIILESAALPAGVIRKSAQRYKTLSEASVRFSKTLDPMQTDLAIKRYVYLAQHFGLMSMPTQSMAVVGQDVVSQAIYVAHEKIQAMLGLVITSNQVVTLLESIDFVVVVQEQGYMVTPPTYRISKDIKMAADVIEEIGRLYGYDHIVPQLPSRQIKPFDQFIDDRTLQIKQYCAYTMGMHELAEYAFYDESFLQILQWRPENAVAINNPVSENWQVLVTSLIPHLLKNIHTYEKSHTSVRFFEKNAVWKKISENEHEEKQVLAGVIFEQEFSFYEGKAYLQGLFAQLGLSVEFRAINGQEPWYTLYQTAGLYVDDKLIGTAGILHPLFTACVAKGVYFAFELDMNALLIKPKEVTFAPWSKYQEVTHDVSALLADSVRAVDLVEAIKQADKRIIAVRVVDCFKKAEWVEQKALTVRYTMVDEYATMTQADLEAITQAVEHIVVNLGGVVRV